MCTLAVHDRNAGNALLDKHVDDVHDRCIHGRCSKVLIRSYVQVSEGPAQLLCLFDIDRDELQDAILCNDADHHGPICFVIAVYDGYAPGTRLEHSSACFVYGLVGMDGDCFYGFDAEGFLDV